MTLKHKTRDIERVPIVQRAPQRTAQTANELEHPLHPTVALQRAMSLRSSALRPADILSLQQTIGNGGVGRMLAGRARKSRRLTIQAKLVVGQAGDQYEREADRVAATVMQTPEPSTTQIQSQLPEEDQEHPIQTKPLVSSITPLIQRQVTPEEEEKETAVQRQSDGGQMSVAPRVEHGIERARGGGHSLPRNLLTRMERSFGADFGSVRVHADSEADSLNRSLRARAFTTGQDLFFRSGEYNPDSRRGQELIAHELTHVLQQSRVIARKTSVQRAYADAIPSNSDGSLADRDAWKRLSPTEKALALAAAPVLTPLVQAWESGSGVASEIYHGLVGKDSHWLWKGIAGTLALASGAVGGVYGLTQGALQGLAYGIGNPLFSMGKRLVKGIRAIPGVIGDFWNWIKGASWKGFKEAVYRVPKSIDEARGIYDSDPKHEKYKGRENYNYDTKLDLVNYTMQATAATTAVSKFFASLATHGKAISEMGAVSGVVGTVTSVWDAAKGFGEWRDAARKTSEQRLGLGKGISGLSSATQQSATAAYQIGSSAVAATAQVVSGSAAIATGAVDILRGGYGAYTAHQNLKRLLNVESSTRLTGPEGRDIKKAAHQAASTQEMRKTTAIGTAVKGLAAVIGGSLLAASVATPVGWILLGAGAAIGGILAIKKWWDKKKRKEEIAMNEYGVTKEERKAWEKKKDQIESETSWWNWKGRGDRHAERARRLQELKGDPLDEKLKADGFKSVGDFYKSYINYLANKILSEGARGRHNLQVQIRDHLTAWSKRMESIRMADIADLLEMQALATSLESFAGVSRMDDKEIKRNFTVEIDRENPYPDVVELLAGMGLKFKWEKDPNPEKDPKPVEPTPEKVGKSLHD